MSPQLPNSVPFALRPRFWLCWLALWALVVLAPAVPVSAQDAPPEAESSDAAPEEEAFDEDLDAPGTGEVAADESAAGEDLSDAVSAQQDENPAANFGAGSAPAEDGGESDAEQASSVPLEKPVDKPVSEMTPEERKLFREWRRARLAETLPPPLPDQPPEDAVTFDLSFPESEGGGSAEGWAGALNYRQDEMAELSGGVVIRYQEVEIRADRIDVDLEQKVVMAYGDVILDQGPQRLSGSTLNYDLQTKTGSVTDAKAFMSPDFYFSGAEVRKTGELTYEVENGVFTSCRGDSPAWSFRLGQANIEVDGYARVKNASMRIKKAPVLYLPYILWPVKSGRTSGFLVPNIGYSERRGGYLGLAYYQVLGRSYDTTFFADLYSEEYLGFGNEFRYRPSEGTRGRFQGYVIRDPVSEDWLWKLNLDHETTDLPFGMRGVVSVREFSDFEFFREFERSVDKNTVRSLESRGFVTGNWGAHSLNILANRRETFLTGNTVTLSRLPEVEYRLRPRKLGNTPLFLQMESSASFLSVERSEVQDGTYGRFDLAPQLTLPLRLVPWLGVSVSAGHRLTWYGDSLNGQPDASPTPGVDPIDPPPVDGFSGDNLTRSFSFASAEVVGPSFSRIFDMEGGSFSKFKHVIEPRFTYAYRSDIDDLDEIPVFDEIDSIRGANLGRVALINRLLAKPRTEDGEDGPARELLSWELSRFYSFDEDAPLQTASDGRSTSIGPLSSLLRFNPTSVTSLTARVDYNTLFSQLTSSSVSGAIGFGANRLGVSWRTSWDAETGQRQSDQMRLTGRLQVWPRRLALQTDVVYDIDNSLLQQQRYILDYRSQCYSLRFEVHDIRRGDERDQDFRFSVNLKNVGTFLDLTN